MDERSKRGDHDRATGAQPADRAEAADRAPRTFNLDEQLNQFNRRDRRIIAGLFKGIYDIFAARARKQLEANGALQGLSEADCRRQVKKQVWSEQVWEAAMTHYHTLGEAVYDDLTGLYRRVSFFEHVSETRKKTAQSGAVLFIDLNDLKVINDTHGHGAADELLRAIGEKINNIIRPNDAASRYGGDEFVLFLNGLPAGKVENAAARILKSISQLVILGDMDNTDHKIAADLSDLAKSKLKPLAENQSILASAEPSADGRNKRYRILTHASFSIGARPLSVDELRSAGELKSWINEADQAMQEIKRGGREGEGKEGIAVITDAESRVCKTLRFDPLNPKTEPVVKTVGMREPRDEPMKEVEAADLKRSLGAILQRCKSECERDRSRGEYPEEIEKAVRNLAEAINTHCR